MWVQVSRSASFECQQVLAQMSTSVNLKQEHFPFTSLEKRVRLAPAFQTRLPATGKGVSQAKAPSSIPCRAASSLVAKVPFSREPGTARSLDGVDISSELDQCPSVGLEVLAMLSKSRILPECAYLGPGLRVLNPVTVMFLGN